MDAFQADDYQQARQMILRAALEAGYPLRKFGSRDGLPN
jgi:hypothetical protein